MGQWGRGGGEDVIVCTEFKSVLKLTESRHAFYYH